MDETINKTYNMDPDSFEVPRQSNADKANRLVYRQNEIKPAANLEEVQKQNSVKQNQILEKRNSSEKFRPSPGNKSPKSINEAVGKDKETEDKKPYYGKALVFGIVVLIIIEYYMYIIARLDNSKGNYNSATNNMIILAVFHILFFMMIWSLTVTMITHPGEIPLYWGFHIGDADYKRKRYCLICNAFKPERAHHCSVCNICVLNMDHHCPWVNNCIGFYNRRFFMQLLFYLLFLLYFIIITSIFPIYDKIMILYKSRHSMHYGLIFTYALNFSAFGIVLVLAVLNTFFFKFHINLTLRNITTIESLDTEFHKNNKFSLSAKENWLQVFGNNVLLWFVPLVAESALPIGDGLLWKTNEIMENLSAINQSSITDRNDSSVHKNDIGVIKQYVEKEMKKRNDKMAFVSSNGNYKTTLNEAKIFSV